MTQQHDYQDMIRIFDHCFFDDFSTFNQTVGTYEELQTYLEGYVANLARADEKRHAK